MQLQSHAATTPVTPVDSPPCVACLDPIVGESFTSCDHCGARHHLACRTRSGPEKPTASISLQARLREHFGYLALMNLSFGLIFFSGLGLLFAVPTPPIFKLAFLVLGIASTIGVGYAVFKRMVYMRDVSYDEARAALERSGVRLVETLCARLEEGEATRSSGMGLTFVAIPFLVGIFPTWWDTFLGLDLPIAQKIC